MMWCDNGIDFTDYTGKVNDHQRYVQLLKQLEKTCIEVEYVPVDEDDVAFIEHFAQDILLMKHRHTWWGTKSGKKHRIYRLRATKNMFSYLKQFETFCKYVQSERGDTVIETDFGINDIAFFDQQEKPLLFTTTHEGYITVRKDVARSLETIRTGPR